ncbi:hypothetical protein Xmau_00212 [Xenorhabdus mauleonii]|uniref:Type VI secretion system secreted protein Hcp n=1 Tax=Xenorhabdus mauleonii TaxID=351675 RepID=A0A1I3N0A5_9GAMM|nr:Hcp family type VI secretion system effector [Xenorhabdus mauleonii]PHM45824.1 hypothetical protein Xmau_00212 [Xenorhabdus mauleonii]SFJ02651.1 hypothetical protein SAMN05421680_10548 [Xenorhabdus mauleonii]
MANIIYLTLKGDKQGVISQGCSSVESIGNKYQVGHENEIFVLNLHHSIHREQNVNHSPIVFIKPQDKSSPLLMMAISDNETLNLKFDFYRTAQSGAQELYYSIECRDATIIELSPNYPHSANHSEAQPEEKVSIKYKDIICHHHMAGTSGYSVWDDRVY